MIAGNPILEAEFVKKTVLLTNRRVLAVVNVAHASQIHIMFRARLIEERFGAGEETLEAALYGEADIPWPLIAFPSVRFTLERFFSDRSAGVEEVHVTSVARIKY